MKEIIKKIEDHKFVINYEFTDLEWQILMKIYDSTFTGNHKDFTNRNFVIYADLLSEEERSYLNLFTHPFRQRMLKIHKYLIGYEEYETIIELTYFAITLIKSSLEECYVVKFYDEDECWNPEAQFKDRKIAEAYIKHFEQFDNYSRNIETIKYHKTKKFQDEEYKYLLNEKKEDE